MSSLKIRLLIGLLAFSTGILFVWFYFSSKQTEMPLEVSIQASQSSARKAVVSDSRFDRVDHDDILQAETDALLPLFDDQMPSVPIYIKDEPILKSGTNTETSNAYTHCDAQEFPIIFVKKIYYQNAHSTRLINTLKHELTHAWLCRQRLMSAGHGVIFRRKLKQVGGWISQPKQS